MSVRTAKPAVENETLRDGFGLGLVLVLIAAAQFWGALFGA
ncbi:hypothetical protein [Amphiplicatus metriothermophilus]|uniref:Uncharacterized protein n=1 Tax=Amphiplicatus metriothermophilus TaxID=1519374 RepID=A0A239PRK8_9PROT|nr:hypothetical protein [Amphiplicatus metriothermophilus]MBB5518502.1 hypothetical protein [Amphiplicatus metriothermophilus]SNT72337.1 hypothetical protein SAMN06297382_1377 [Amphiplicatus metriothermophilus]